MARQKIGTYIIPVSKPWCDARKLKEFYKVYISGNWGMGSKTELFEKKFAEYLDPTNSITTIGVNSGIAALHLALRVSGIKHGDEVITTPIAFAPAVEAILYNGATPVFADVEYNTLNIDPIDIERKITPNTKAIIPGHYGGNPCNIDAIIDIANRHNLIIIEDCAGSIGAEYTGNYSGKKIGCANNISCFSFNTTDNLAIGEGGMIVFPNNKEIEERIRRMINLGITKDPFKRNPLTAAYSWDYDIIEQGWSYKMNDLSATIGIGQLDEIDKLNESRRYYASIYDKQFSKIRQIDIPITSDKSSRSNYTIKLHGIVREELIKDLAAKKISTDVYYKPLYLHPRYNKFYKANTPIADGVWQSILSIPLYPSMGANEIPYIIRATKTYINDLLIRLMVKKKRTFMRPSNVTI